MAPIKTGDKPKDFSLKDQKGNVVKLSDLKGKKVLLSFHPLAWTGICAKQMQSLEANEEKLGELGTSTLVTARPPSRFRLRGRGGFPEEGSKWRARRVCS